VGLLCHKSENYLQRLDELDKVTRAVVASIPPENRKLLTYHDSWAYWAKEYDFDVIGAIHRQISTSLLLRMWQN